MLPGGPLPLNKMLSDRQHSRNATRCVYQSSWYMALTCSDRTIRLIPGTGRPEGQRHALSSRGISRQMR
jgi:hypothetical protein